MSLTHSHPLLSKPLTQLGLTTVIGSVVLMPSPVARVVGAYADAASLVALIGACWGMAAKHSNQFRPPLAP
jgi:hypothetical protein